MPRRALTQNEASWLTDELDRLFGLSLSEGLERLRNQVRHRVQNEILRHGVPQSEQAVRGMVRRYSTPLVYQQHIRQE